MNVFLISPSGLVTPAQWQDDVPLPVHQLRNAVGGNIEYCAVVFNGKPATLVVNEVGASLDPSINPKGQLPPNARATAIYWTATALGITGAPFEPLYMPMIHGTAVLIEKDKREL